LYLSVLASLQSTFKHLKLFKIQKNDHHGRDGRNEKRSCGLDDHEEAQTQRPEDSNKASEESTEVHMLQRREHVVYIAELLSFLANYCTIFASPYSQLLSSLVIPPWNMQRQQQEPPAQKQQQQQFSWPPATWYEDALGCREVKRAFLKNQQVLYQMQQRARQAGFPHSFAIGNTDGAAAVTKDNVIQYGEFSCPTVQQLREECEMLKQQLYQDEKEQQQHQEQQQQKDDGHTIVWHTFPHTNVLHLFADDEKCYSANIDSTFQAASQFNCLEMTGPSVTPELGISQYVNDRTQGPALTMACQRGPCHEYEYE
jgi:hypothetical protein